MKLNKTQQTAIKKFLETNKEYFGLREFEIVVRPEIEDEPMTVSRVIADIYEHTLTIIICPLYLNQTKEKKINTLIHELIHARVNVFEQKWKISSNELRKAQEAIKNEEEEFMVNDITKGFLRFNNDIKTSTKDI